LRIYFLGDVLGEAAGWVFGYLCYALGRRALLVVTVGRVRPEEARNGTIAFPWYGLARGRDGRRVLSSAFTSLVGLATFVLIIVVFVLALNALRSMVPNITFDRTAGSHSLATASQRER
jgi:hypothetical protein